MRTIGTEVTNNIHLPLVAGDSMTDLPPVNEILVAALEKANTEVHASVPDGGTTCTAAVLLRNRAFLAHAGDSRAYFITREEIEQITRDHSVVQRLVELGQLTEEEADAHERGNELYRALGYENTLEVDAFSRSLPARSKLLLCSDGLWNLVGDREIHKIVHQFPDPQEACQKLVNLAKTRGGDDNISVVIVSLG